MVGGWNGGGEGMGEKSAAKAPPESPQRLPEVAPKRWRIAPGSPPNRILFEAFWEGKAARRRACVDVGGSGFGVQGSVKAPAAAGKLRGRGCPPRRVNSWVGE